MWNIKYYSDWKDLKGNDNRIEILTKDSVVVKEVKISSFTITHPTIDLFSDVAVYGSGANITLISEDRLDYYNMLYSVNPQTFLFKHYLNNSLNFIGYLDTEQYQDSFSNGVNYDFSITANNGLSVLDRIKITDDSGTELDGIYNTLDIIKFALNKLNISYDKVYLGVSTTINNIGTNETLLHKLNVKSDNYIDEKGNWMSCREVINAILLPLTLRLHIIGNNIYIVDIHKLASEDNLTLKQYNFSDLSYVQDVTISNLFEINKSLNNAVLSKKSGVNKVDVKFNKYVYDVPTTLTEGGVESLSGYISESTKIKDDGETQEEYIEKYYSNGWFEVLDPTKVKFVHRRRTDIADDGEVFVRIEGTANEGDFSPAAQITVKTNQDFASSRQYLRINGQIMVEDLDNFLIEDEIAPTGLYDEVEYPLGVQFRVYGNGYIDYWHNTTKSWREVEEGYTYPFMRFYINAGAANNNGKTFPINTWIDLSSVLGEDSDIYSFIVPLNSDQKPNGTYEYSSLRGGTLEFSIAVFKQPFEQTDKNYSLAIKDLSFTLLREDEYGNYVEVDNNDNEYQGTVNTSFVNNLSIETKHGTDTEGNSRGMFLVKISGQYSDSDYATNERLVNADNFQRAGNEGTTEELLLNTYLSNLQKSRNLLSVTLLDYYSMINIFKYKINSKLENLKLIPVSLTCDYLNAESSVQLLEFVKDEVL